jgi:hypothetical protein
MYIYLSYMLNKNIFPGGKPTTKPMPKVIFVIYRLCNIGAVAVRGIRACLCL